MSQIRPRRPRRHGRPLAVPALLTALLVTVAGGCGFDYATDQVYDSSSGVDSRVGDLDVLNAAVVSGQQGSGTFVATFANNSLTAPEQVVAVSPGAETVGLQVQGFTAVEVPAGGATNLAESPTAVVTGDFIPGDFVEVLLDLRDGDDVELSVPVVADRGFWEGLDVSVGASSSGDASPEPSESPSESVAVE